MDTLIEEDQKNSLLYANEANKTVMKKVLGSGNDCLKQHFYEIFITYRFLDSFR